jgi:hypothetical protein
MLMQRLQAGAENDTSGLARYEIRWNAPISVMIPVMKSMINTVLIVETVESIVSKRRSSIIWLHITS